MHEKRLTSRKASDAEVNHGLSELYREVGRMPWPSLRGGGTRGGEDPQLEASLPFAFVLGAEAAWDTDDDEDGDGDGSRRRRRRHAWRNGPLRRPPPIVSPQRRWNTYF